MPVGGQGEGGPDGGPENPAHIISRLFECLAQVCSALGLFSLAALFYAHSVEIVRHLAPGAPQHSPVPTLMRQWQLLLQWPLRTCTGMLLY